LKLIVTGGGTGGHIYPALEVARFAKERGAEILYLGSLRGQEGKICSTRGVTFQGFPSEPLYSLKTARGWKSLVRLAKAKGLAKRALLRAKADAVFSTGGYSAGPVVAAARSLGIPYFIHEANSVPGRANLMFAKQAKAFTTLFKSTERYANGVHCERVGQPVRHELREAVGNRSPEPDFVLCVGGSQGSEYLNGSVPRAFAGDQLSHARLLIASGPKNFEVTSKVVSELGISDRVTVRPYLETAEMLEAYQRATVVVGRSGSTLAEFAMFGIPSVLVPLPTSAGDHQLHNAEEFVEMNAATFLRQQDATPSALADAVAAWLGDKARIDAAKIALQSWDIPDATERIFARISGVAK
jgi:UDP-N-acetylglucosamine--N-acetylmuramyl-(pentapeptide) pyrophosphoryl-undecaprenol N-acetylglucosamine transferase